MCASMPVRLPSDLGVGALHRGGQRLEPGVLPGPHRRLQRRGLSRPGRPEHALDAVAGAGDGPDQLDLLVVESGALGQHRLDGGLGHHGGAGVAAPLVSGEDALLDVEHLRGWCRAPPRPPS